MSIQFYCPSCRRPIEVDDEAANQMVLCPYCNATNRAPASSNFELHSATAVPGAPAAIPAQPPAIEYAPKTTSCRPARFGWVALAFAIASIICTFVYITSVIPVLQPPGPNVDFEAMHKEILKLHQDRPWLTVVDLIMMVSPFASLALGIVGLAMREKPRWPAIAALCLSGACTLAFCASVGMTFLLMPT